MQPLPRRNETGDVGFGYNFYEFIGTVLCRASASEAWSGILTIGFFFFASELCLYVK